MPTDTMLTDEECHRLSCCTEGGPNAPDHIARGRTLEGGIRLFYESMHLTAPMSDEEVERIADKDGYIEVYVLLNFEEVASCGSIDGLNDMAEEKILDGGILSDITYQPIAVLDGDVLVRVRAEVVNSD